jgi:hypothetical protein
MVEMNVRSSDVTEHKNNTENININNNTEHKNTENVNISINNNTENINNNKEHKNNISSDSTSITIPIDSKSLPCGHVYHTKCIVEWLSVQGTEQGKMTCPTCRRQIYS